MRCLVATILSLFLLGCSEQVEETYSTYSEAQRAGAIERGWIPSFVPSNARDIKDTHDLDTSRQTLSFIIPSAAAAGMVSGLRAVSAKDTRAASKLIDQHNLTASSNVYVVCSTDRKGALAVDAETGRVVFTTTVGWVDDDCG